MYAYPQQRRTGYGGDAFDGPPAAPQIPYYTQATRPQQQYQQPNMQGGLGNRFARPAYSPNWQGGGQANWSQYGGARPSPYGGGMFIGVQQADGTYRKGRPLAPRSSNYGGMQQNYGLSYPYGRNYHQRPPRPFSYGYTR